MKKIYIVSITSCLLLSACQSSSEDNNENSTEVVEDKEVNENEQSSQENSNEEETTEESKAKKAEGDEQENSTEEIAAVEGNEGSEDEVTEESEEDTSNNSNLLSGDESWISEDGSIDIMDENFIKSALDVNTEGFGKFKNGLPMSEIENKYEVTSRRGGLIGIGPTFEFNELVVLPDEKKGEVAKVGIADIHNNEYGEKEIREKYGDPFHRIISNTTEQTGKVLYFHENPLQNEMLVMNFDGDKIRMEKVPINSTMFLTVNSTTLDASEFALNYSSMDSSIGQQIKDEFKTMGYIPKVIGNDKMITSRTFFFGNHGGGDTYIKSSDGEIMIATQDSPGYDGYDIHALFYFTAYTPNDGVVDLTQDPISNLSTAEGYGNEVKPETEMEKYVFADNGKVYKATFKQDNIAAGTYAKPNIKIDRHGRDMLFKPIDDAEVLKLFKESINRHIWPYNNEHEYQEE